VTSQKPDPLFSQEAEQAVIGAILINPGVVSGINISPEQFYIRRLGHVWSACRALDARQAGIDLVTICEELERMGKLAEVGGAAYLTGLINATPSSYGVEDYVSIVADYSRRRVWRDLANRVAKTAFDLDQDLEQAAPAIVDELLRAVQAPGAAVHVAEFTRRVVDQALERSQGPERPWGIPTGFVDFDQITGGLQTGEVLYISGEPGKGKSILADQMAFQMAAAGHPGVIYSLEMPGEQVVRRRLSAMSQLLVREIKSGRLDGRFGELQAAAADVDRLPLYLSDSVQWTTASLRADLTRMQAQHGAEWFVLDYAYLLQDGRGMSENDRTGQISAQLKSICRGLNLAGIVILSLNKTGMRDATKTGVEVRGSGQQFYDADLMILLDDQPNEKNVIRVTFGKGRELENPRQTFRLTKLEKYPAFENYAHPAQPGRYS